jgi:ADP-ribose pyrophosphatase YjhB (NUDIX family)
MRATQGFPGQSEIDAEERAARVARRAAPPTGTVVDLDAARERRNKRAGSYSVPLYKRECCRIVLASPTYIVFILKTWMPAPQLWSLAGGGKDPEDRNIAATAFREMDEEIRLRGVGRRHLVNVWENVRGSESVALVYVPDELILRTPTVGRDNGRELKIKVFRRDEISRLASFNPRHVELLMPALAFLEEQERDCDAPAL